MRLPFLGQPRFPLITRSNSRRHKRIGGGNTNNNVYSFTHYFIQLLPSESLTGFRAAQLRLPGF